MQNTDRLDVSKGPTRQISSAPATGGGDGGWGAWAGTSDELLHRAGTTRAVLEDATPARLMLAVCSGGAVEPADHSQHGSPNSSPLA